MLRILTVTNWFPPHHLGGYELSCLDVMHRFASRGHAVEVLCGDTTFASAAPPPHLKLEGHVRRTLRLYHDGTDILRPPWRERHAIEQHNRRALLQALAEVQPDVVSVWHLAGLSHGLLGVLAEAGVPVVFAVCDDWLVYGSKLDAWVSPFEGSPLRRALGRIVGRVTGLPAAVPDIGSMGAFLFVSAATQATAERDSRFRFERADVVWSGIDRDTYPARAQDGHRPWRWSLVSTGRFDPRKGFDTAIRALPLLPVEATLDLWGRGGADEITRLRTLAAELGVEHRVRFGSLDREELPAVYAAADAMIFPSTWPEPFGLVPVEAMACGTPVVATGVGGSGEFLEHERNCLVVPPGDPVALADALVRLAEDDALRARLVEGGDATAEVLDVERLADVMEAWHRYEASGRQGATPTRRVGVPPERGAS